MEEQKNPPKPVHQTGVGTGETFVTEQGKEPGREDTADTIGAGEVQSTGTREARDSTGITPDTTGPIDPASPDMPPP
jgi:hypothetical protein